MRNRNINKNGLFPCLSGQAIFEKQELKEYLQQIKHLLGCSEDVYQTFYLSLLYRLAEFLQAMPYSSSEHMNEYGFLRRQLLLTITALKLKRGVLLPKDANAEMIALEEPQWTYAIFSAALLKDIHQLAQDREVALYNEKNEKIASWSALSGSLYENDCYYNIKLLSKKPAQKADIFMAAIADRVIPTIAFHWLNNNQRLFKLWWSSILRDPADNNELNKIIATAIQNLGFHITETLGDSTENYQDQVKLFLSWLMEQAKNYPDLVFRLKKGIFVGEALLTDYLSERPNLSKAVLLQHLEKANSLVIENDNQYHILQPKRIEDRRTLRGIILSQECLPEDLNYLPVNNYFVEH